MFRQGREKVRPRDPSLGGLASVAFAVGLAMLVTGVVLTVKNSGGNEARTEDFDYVIVGGGAAGSIMAERLSRSGQYKVLLIEAGPNEESDFALDEIGPWTREISSYDMWQYFWQHIQRRQSFSSRRYDEEAFARGVPPPSEPTLPAASKHQWVYSSGRVLGGNSKVNNGIFTRGTDFIFDQWETLSGDSIWSTPNVLQAYRELEKYYSENFNPVRRGFTGPLTITDQASAPSDMAQKLVAALEQLTNLTRLEDYNDMFTASRLGPVLGWQMTVDENRTRTSADVAILNETVRQRKNLSIKAAATATRVVFDGRNHARGVEYLRNGHEFVAHAKRRVVLTAGINNAAILHHSGIGDMEDLMDAKIPIVVNNSAVGRNLFNHLKVTATFQKNNADFTSEEPAVVYEGGAFLPDPLNNMHDHSPRQFQMLATNNWDEMYLSLIDLQPFADGTDRVYSRDPLRVSRVDQVDDEDDGDADISMLARGVEHYICKLHEEYQGYGHGPAIDTEYRLVDPPLSICNDTSELRDWVNFNMDPRMYQWSSSCRMGEVDDGASVVNSRGSVWGVTGLTIADRSIMPVPHDGDTTSASYIIAKIIAEHIIAGTV